MASSIVASSGRALGSRHNSHSNLVSSDSGGFSDWLNNSNDDTPKALHYRQSSSSFINNNNSSGSSFLHRNDSYTSLSDGFDIISPPPPLSWSSTLESGVHADHHLSTLTGSSDTRSFGFINTLHEADMFKEYSSGSSSPSITLPGWNNDPVDAFGSSDADSPEGIWYGQVQHSAKATRRGLMRNTPSFMLHVDQSDFGSPGASNHDLSYSSGQDLFPSAASPDSGDAGLLLAPMTRSLRSAVSAPCLPRTEPLSEDNVTDGSDFASDRFADAVSAASNKDIFSSMTHLADSADSPTFASPQSSALFQRRSVQRDGNLSEPSPVNVSTAAVDQASSGGSNTASSGASTSSKSAITDGGSGNLILEADKRAEAKRLRLLQLQQMQLSHEHARISFGKEMAISPSQQQQQHDLRLDLGGKLARSASAANMYGTDMSAVRHGLMTPITPQNPLHPVNFAAQFGGGYALAPRHDSIREEGSLDVSNLSPSHSASQFATSAPLHGQHLQVNQQQRIFTPQYLHQQDTASLLTADNSELFIPVGSIQQGSGDMSGYTSVYPAMRHNSISNGHADRAWNGLTLTPAGISSSGSSVPHRRASHATLSRTSESSPSLATLLANNPMQLQNPFAQLQRDQALGNVIRNRSHSSLEPSRLMPSDLQGGLEGTGTVDPSNFLGLSLGPAADVPHSAPADASKDSLSQMQQERMLQLQQQQPQFLQYQYNAKQTGSQRSSPVNGLTSPLTPPRSPMKTKSASHLKSPLGGVGGSLSSPGGASKPERPTLRKIASNRRVAGPSSATSLQPPSLGSYSSSNNNSASSFNSSSLESPASISSTLSPRIVPANAKPLPTPASALRGNKVNKGFTMELMTSASPNRAAHHSPGSSLLQPPRPTAIRASKSSSSLSPSLHSTTGTDAAIDSATGGFARLSFVNYGIDDADEICSAVAPSGSYKVPLRGYENGSGSSGEEDYSDEQGRTGENGATLSPNLLSSPTKKLRKNSSKASLAGSGSPLRGKRSMANVGASRSSADLLRSPRKTKPAMLASPAGSGTSTA